MVREIRQKEHPRSFHSRRDCEKSRRYDKRKFILRLYVGYFKDPRHSSKKTPITNHLKAKIVRLHKSVFNELS